MFSCVLVSLSIFIRLSIRLPFMSLSEFAIRNPVMQSFIVIFLGSALDAILKLRYDRPVIAPLGWRVPNRSCSAIAFWVASSPRSP